MFSAFPNSKMGEVALGDYWLPSLHFWPSEVCQVQVTSS